MICIFIQLRCRPGRTYEVADALYDMEFASELYSTSGEWDLLVFPMNAPAPMIVLYLPKPS